MGEQHPTVAIRLNNLAALLQDTDRLAEAETLVRRALAIDEVAYGEQHPKVAADLNNLALLLHATDRLAEAEPLLRRAMDILESFRRQTGHEHPRFKLVIANYVALQWAMGTDEPEGSSELEPEPPS